MNLNNNNNSNKKKEEEEEKGKNVHIPINPSLPYTSVPQLSQFEMYFAAKADQGPLPTSMAIFPPPFFKEHAPLSQPSLLDSEHIFVVLLSARFFCVCLFLL